MNLSKQKSHNKKDSAMAGTKTNQIITRVATYSILVIMTFFDFRPNFLDDFNFFKDRSGYV